MSFPLFRGEIEKIVADMGGGSRARQAVGDWFSDTLHLQIGRYRENDPGHYARTEWYSASDAQFEAAARQSMSVLSSRPDQEETAQAPFMTGKIVVFQTRVYLVTPGGYYIPLVSYYETTKFDYRLSKDVPDYNISIDRPGEVLADTRFGSSNPTSTHAKTCSGAYKSLRSMTEKHFKVSLENVG